MQHSKVGVVKERTSVVSTPSLAELYKFAMNFLLVKKRKMKEQGRQEEKEVERESQSEETTHMDDYGDGVKMQDSNVSQM